MEENFEEGGTNNSSGENTPENGGKVVAKTQGMWRSGKKVLQPEDRYKEELEKHEYLKQERYRHKREQLYLMLANETNQEILSLFFANDREGIRMNSYDMDFIRIMYFLTNDIVFLKENCIGKSFYYEEVLEAYTARLLVDIKPLEDQIAELKHEKERLTEEFKDKVGFLLKKFNYEQQIAEINEKHHSEIQQKDFEKQEQEWKFEIEKQREKIEKLLSEETKLKKLLEKQQRECQKNANSVNILVEEPKDKLFWPFHKDKQEERRKAIYVSALQDYKYSEKQLKIVSYGYSKGFTEEELRYLINPNTPEDNLVLLCKLFARNHNIECPFVLSVIDEEESYE